MTAITGRRGALCTAHTGGRSALQCTATNPPKLHTSTLALVPPEEAWPPIQDVRERLRDKGLYRWPPHINLLYPFVPEDDFAAAADALAPAAASNPPFELSLDAFGVFGGRHRGVLYLCPSAPAEQAALCRLQGVSRDGSNFDWAGAVGVHVGRCVCMRVRSGG